MLVFKNWLVTCVGGRWGCGCGGCGAGGWAYNNARLKKAKKASSTLLELLSHYTHQCIEYSLLENLSSPPHCRSACISEEWLRWWHYFCLVVISCHDRIRMLLSLAYPRRAGASVTRRWMRLSRMSHNGHSRSCGTHFRVPSPFSVLPLPSYSLSMSPNFLPLLVLLGVLLLLRLNKSLGNMWLARGFMNNTPNDK